MAYIGKNLVGVLKEQKSVSTMTGDGSDTTLTLSDTPGSVNNVLVFFDGIRQQPITDYTLSGTTVTFTTAPEAGVIVTAIVGNHSGVNPKPNTVTASKIVDGTVSGDNIASLTNSQVSGLASTKLTGTLPAIDGSALTGVVEHIPVTKSASDPTISTNPSSGIGTMWCNTTTGNMYVCTDATTNNNEWINMGKGTGDIINVAPTNYTDSFPDLIESASTNYTFSGATDDGSVAHYLVEQISNPSLLAVTTAEKPAGQAHTFTTQAVGSDTNVTFVVKTKDNLGKYSSGVTITAAILNNVAPTNPTNTASFADMTESTTQNFTFTGATDPNAGDTVTHYMVDQISNAVLTVTAAEVAAGSAHAFSAGSVAADTAVTFRVRAKDNNGLYSSGVTVSMDVTNLNYIVATGGSISTFGDYKLHVFTTTGNFNVTAVPAGANGTIEYVVVAGGGNGASKSSQGGGMGGGGGAGGLLQGSTTASISSYYLSVGAGRPGDRGQHWSGVTAGQPSGLRGTNSTGFGLTCIGGGEGGQYSSHPGTSGGSGGGGGAGNSENNLFPAGGAGTSGQGNNGGNGNNAFDAGGGGGAGAAGSAPPSTSVGGAGGNGLNLSSTYGSSYGESGQFAGGGGGAHYPNTGAVAYGGSGGGGNGSAHSATSAMTNSGGGGGGVDGQGASGWPNIYGGGGGSGIVIVRYKYQN